MLIVIKIIDDYSFPGCNGGTIVERSTLCRTMMAVGFHSLGFRSFYKSKWSALLLVLGLKNNYFNWI